MSVLHSARYCSWVWPWPQAVAYSYTNVGERLYVANLRGGGGYGTVSVLAISYNGAMKLTNIATIQVGTAGNYPVALALSPDAQRVYVANSTDGTISVINTATNEVTATIAVGPGLTGEQAPGGVAVSPDGTRLYVTNGGKNTVAVISTATNAVINTIPVGSAPEGIAISPDGHRLYVANYSSNTVSVIAV